jgi:hypothetical protein
LPDGNQDHRKYPKIPDPKMPNFGDFYLDVLGRFLSGVRTSRAQAS